MISMLAAHLFPDLEFDDHEVADAGYALLHDQSILHARIEGPRPIDLRVLRVSPAGLVLTGDTADSLGPGDVLPVTLHLEGRRVGPLGAQVVARDPRASGGPPAIRVCFPDIRIDEARAILELVTDLGGRDALERRPGRVAVVEAVSEPQRLRTVARALVTYHCDGFARGADGTVFTVRGAALAGADDPFPLRWEVEGGWPEPPLTLVIGGLMSLFELTVDRAERVDGLLALPMPDKIVRTRHRWWRRVGGEGPLPVVFRHPQWPELTVSAGVHDISRGGLGLQSTPVTDVLYPGLELPELEVADGELRGLRLRASVRHVNLRRDRADGVCGVQVAAADDESAERWALELEDRLHPHTRSGATWTGHLWELFRDAGYFALSGKSKAHFTHLRQAYGRLLSRLEGAPHIGCQVVWPSDDGLEAGLTALRAYSRTWFGFHMARRKRGSKDGPSGRDLLREIHLHTYELAQRDPSIRWILAYVQESARWPRLPHFEFPRRYVPTGEACTVRFRAWEAACHHGAWPLPGGFEVTEAGTADIDALLAVVARDRPRPYVEAFDFVPKRVTMGELSRQWADAGLLRERAIRVARRGGRAFAAAVLEVASDAAHLYGLLDAVRMFPLVDGGDEAFPALIEDARDWFRGYGKSSFVFLQEYPAAVDLARTGLIDMGAADATVFAAALLPDFIEYVWEVTTGRDEG